MITDINYEIWKWSKRTPSSDSNCSAHLRWMDKIVLTLESYSALVWSSLCYSVSLIICLLFIWLGANAALLPKRRSTGSKQSSKQTTILECDPIHSLHFCKYSKFFSIFRIAIILALFERPPQFCGGLSLSEAYLNIDWQFPLQCYVTLIHRYHKEVRMNESISESRDALWNIKANITGFHELFWFFALLLFLSAKARVTTRSGAPSGTGLNLRTSLCSFSFWFIFCMTGGGCGAITKTKGQKPRGKFAAGRCFGTRLRWFELGLPDLEHNGFSGAVSQNRAFLRKAALNRPFCRDNPRWKIAPSHQIW